MADKPARVISREEALRIVRQQQSPVAAETGEAAAEQEAGWYTEEDWSEEAAAAQHAAVLGYATGDDAGGSAGPGYDAYQEYGYQRAGDSAASAAFVKQEHADYEVDEETDGYSEEPQGWVDEDSWVEAQDGLNSNHSGRSQLRPSQLTDRSGDSASRNQYGDAFSQSQEDSSWTSSSQGFRLPPGISITAGDRGQEPSSSQRRVRPVQPIQRLPSRAHGQTPPAQQVTGVPRLENNVANVRLPSGISMQPVQQELDPPVRLPRGISATPIDHRGPSDTLTWATQSEQVSDDQRSRRQDGRIPERNRQTALTRNPEHSNQSRQHNESVRQTTSSSQRFIGGSVNPPPSSSEPQGNNQASASIGGAENVQEGGFHDEDNVYDEGVGQNVMLPNLPPWISASSSDSSSANVDSVRRAHSNNTQGSSSRSDERVKAGDSTASASQHAALVSSVLSKLPRGISATPNRESSRSLSGSDQTLRRDGNSLPNRGIREACEMSDNIHPGAIGVRGGFNGKSRHSPSELDSRAARSVSSASSPVQACSVRLPAGISVTHNQSEIEPQTRTSRSPGASSGISATVSQPLHGVRLPPGIRATPSPSGAARSVSASDSDGASFTDTKSRATPLSSPLGSEHMHSPSSVSSGQTGSEFRIPAGVKITPSVRPEPTSGKHAGSTISHRTQFTDTIRQPSSGQRPFSDAFVDGAAAQKGFRTVKQELSEAPQTEYQEMGSDTTLSTPNTALAPDISEGNAHQPVYGDEMEGNFDDDDEFEGDEDDDEYFDQAEPPGNNNFKTSASMNSEGDWRSKMTSAHSGQSSPADSVGYQDLSAGRRSVATSKMNSPSPSSSAHSPASVTEQIKLPPGIKLLPASDPESQEKGDFASVGQYRRPVSVPDTTQTRPPFITSSLVGSKRKQETEMQNSSKRQLSTYPMRGDLPHPRAFSNAIRNVKPNYPVPPRSFSPLVKPGTPSPGSQVSAGTGARGFQQVYGSRNDRMTTPTPGFRLPPGISATFTESREQPNFNSSQLNRQSGTFASGFRLPRGITVESSSPKTSQGPLPSADNYRMNQSAMAGVRLPRGISVQMQGEGAQTADAKPKVSSVNSTADSVRLPPGISLQMSSTRGSSLSVAAQDTMPGPSGSRDGGGRQAVSLRPAPRSARGSRLSNLPPDVAASRIAAEASSDYDDDDAGEDAVGVDGSDDDYEPDESDYEELESANAVQPRKAADTIDFAQRSNLASNQQIAGSPCSAGYQKTPTRSPSVQTATAADLSRMATNVYGIQKPAGSRHLLSNEAVQHSSVRSPTKDNSASKTLTLQEARALCMGQSVLDDSRNSPTDDASAAPVELADPTLGSLIGDKVDEHPRESSASNAGSSRQLSEDEQSRNPEGSHSETEACLEDVNTKEGGESVSGSQIEGEVDASIGQTDTEGKDQVIDPRPLDSVFQPAEVCDSQLDELQRGVATNESMEDSSQTLLAELQGEAASGGSVPMDSNGIADDLSRLIGDLQDAPTALVRDASLDGTAEDLSEVKDMLDMLSEKPELLVAVDEGVEASDESAGESESESSGRDSQASDSRPQPNDCSDGDESEQEADGDAQTAGKQRRKLRNRKRRKKKSRSAADAVKSSGDRNSGDEDASGGPVNKRRNIRQIISDEKLDSETLKAQEEEKERQQRLAEQKRWYEQFRREQEVQQKQETESATAAASGSTRTRSRQQSDIITLSSDEEHAAAAAAAQLAADKKLAAEAASSSSAPSGAMNSASAAVPAAAATTPGGATAAADSSDDDIQLLSSAEEEPTAVEDVNNTGAHTEDTCNVPDSLGRVLVNVGHPPNETDIFLAPQLARNIKPHQIGGVRFLYDNLIESLERCKSTPGFGCILAHSMGLGKTMQTVTFADLFLRHTTHRLVLIIVPINTIQNWLNEFNYWMPQEGCYSPIAEGGELRHRAFNVSVLSECHRTTQARAKVIQDWQRDGGVLLMGYEIYRVLSLSSARATRKKKKNSTAADDAYAEERDKLLSENIKAALCRPGPDLVICDEGHRIKNAGANISQALKSIRTRRRLALTGYPLQNNLVEYWCMVDFVRPNFLGNKAEFTNMFDRPIANGQCSDSTPADVRLMRFRSHVLHSLLEGLVQRRSQAILEAALPKKEEYVCLLRMTDLQRTLYKRFMADLIARSGHTPNPLRAFVVSCKIWNHPDVLYNLVRKKMVDEDLELEDTADGTARARRSGAAVGGVPRMVPPGGMGSTPGVSPGASPHPSAVAVMSMHPALVQSPYPGAAGAGGMPGGPMMSMGPGSQPPHHQLQLPPTAEMAAAAAPVTPERAVREDNFINYDWAQELLQTYTPGLVENSTKMMVFRVILEESVRLGDKMLLFSQSLFTLNIIEEFLQQNFVPGRNVKWALNQTYYRLDGSTNGMERERLIHQFNVSAEVPLFLVSTRAGSLGVNLVGANRVLVFDASWNPCHDTQAVCRVYRFGQQKQCYVYRLVTDNSMERRIYDRQVKKQSMSNRVVDESNPENMVSGAINMTRLLDPEDDDPTPGHVKFDEDKFDDPVMLRVLRELGGLFTKEPFEHDAQLVDRQDKRLTQAEKRLAKRSYELEKKASANGLSRGGPFYGAGGRGGAMGMYRGMYSKPVANVRPMMTGGRMLGRNPSISQLGTSRFSAEQLARQGVTMSHITVPKDVSIPTGSGEGNPIFLRAGQTVLVIKTAKGVYLRLQDGRIIAIRMPSGAGAAGSPTASGGVPDFLSGGSGVAASRAGARGGSSRRGGRSATVAIPGTSGIRLPRSITVERVPATSDGGSVSTAQPVVPQWARPGSSIAMARVARGHRALHSGGSMKRVVVPSRAGGSADPLTRLQNMAAESAQQSQSRSASKMKVVVKPGGPSTLSASTAGVRAAVPTSAPASVAAPSRSASVATSQTDIEQQPTDADGRTDDSQLQGQEAKLGPDDTAGPLQELVGAGDHAEGVQEALETSSQMSANAAGSGDVGERNMSMMESLPPVQHQGASVQQPSSSSGFNESLGDLLSEVAPVLNSASSLLPVSSAGPAGEHPHFLQQHQQQMHTNTSSVSSLQMHQNMISPSVSSTQMAPTTGLLCPPDQLQHQQMPIQPSFLPAMGHHQQLYPTTGGGSHMMRDLYPASATQSASTPATNDLDLLRGLHDMQHRPRQHPLHHDQAPDGSVGGSYTVLGQPHHQITPSSMNRQRQQQHLLPQHDQHDHREPDFLASLTRQVGGGDVGGWLDSAASSTSGWKPSVSVGAPLPAFSSVANAGDAPAISRGPSTIPSASSSFHHHSSSPIVSSSLQSQLLRFPGAGHHEQPPLQHHQLSLPPSFLTSAPQQHSILAPGPLMDPSSALPPVDPYQWPPAMPRYPDYGRYAPPHGYATPQQQPTAGYLSTAGVGYSLAAPSGYPTHMQPTGAAGYAPAPYPAAYPSSVGGYPTSGYALSTAPATYGLASGAAEFAQPPVTLAAVPPQQPYSSSAGGGVFSGAPQDRLPPFSRT